MTEEPRLTRVLQAASGRRPDWETPTPEGLLAAHRRWFTAQDELIVALREDVRWWQFAFLLVTVQFAVMFVAALWGWLR